MAAKLSAGELARSRTDFDPPTEEGKRPKRPRLTAEDCETIKDVLSEWYRRTAKLQADRKKLLAGKTAGKTIGETMRKRGEMLERVEAVLAKI